MMIVIVIIIGRFAARDENTRGHGEGEEDQRLEWFHRSLWVCWRTRAEHLEQAKVRIPLRIVSGAQTGCIFGRRIPLRARAGVREAAEQIAQSVAIAEVRSAFAGRLRQEV